MKELTKAEEQVMQILWELEKGFIRDILNACVRSDTCLYNGIYHCAHT